ncbi:cytochrome b562 [Vibrio scophthalmi]|uniref:Soluble cytochrome b562 n=1 Tax=Vibrio scophthalmi TaxID=45658 RepID=A0A1E3WGL8_9VIBR|nr:cytochrome b562 [Vibrio scophthalmi]ODS04920.1 hypothetical protein VSF3289_04060 [Vibrio scophthalmi]
MLIRTVLRRTLLLVMTIFAAQSFASSFDMKSAMNEMKLNFKHAAEAQSVEEMTTAMTSFNQVLVQLQNARFPTEKQALYTEGFEQLDLVVEGVEKQLEQGNLEQAKAQLKAIDDLRVEFHEKRNPSIWSKLFG